MMTKWTDKIPTRSGYYWWRLLPTEKDSQNIIEVYSENGKMMCVDSDGDIELEGMRGQFNGPLVPPK